MKKELNGLNPETTGTVLPTVIYEDRVNSSRSPLTISFDGQRFAQMLRDHFSFSDNDLRHLTVRLSPDHGQTTSHQKTKGGIVVREGFTLAVTEHKNDKLREIVVNAGYPNIVYMTLCSTAGSYMAIRRMPEQLHPATNTVAKGFEGILDSHFKTKRLTRYLKVAPAERATRFLDGLIVRKLNKDMASVVLHEARHVYDYNQLSKHHSIDRARAAGRTVFLAASAYLTVKLAELVTNRDVYDEIQLGMLGTAVAAGLYSLVRSRQIGNRYKQFESLARDETKNIPDGWFDIVKLSPNPEFNWDQYDKTLTV